MPAAFHYAAVNSLLVTALTVFSLPLILAFAKANSNEESEFWHRIVSWVTQNHRVVIWSLAAAFFIAIISCVWALRAFPNSGDEYVYLFQADTFLAGRLWNDLDPLHQYFSFYQIFEKDGKWVGQYPPGWSLILACAKFLAIPAWAASPICAVLLLLVAARLYGSVGGQFAAVVGTILVALNSFFLMNGASYFSHIATALFGTLFVLYGLRYLDYPTIRSSLIVGSSLGAVGIIRPYSAVLFAIPFAVELLIRRRYQFKTLAWIIVGGLPFLVGLLAYDWAITGNPFLLVRQWGYPLERLGFHPHDPTGDEVNLFDTSLMAIQRLAELAAWTSPSLILLYLFAGFKTITLRTFRFYDFIFPVFIAGYLLFPDDALGGNRYGPRLYFEAYPFMALTIVSAVTPILMAKLDRINALVLGIVLATPVIACLMMPIHVYENHQVVNERMKPFDAVREKNISHAVVVLLTGSGSIAPMAEMDLTRNGIRPRSADVIFALSRTDPAWLLATGNDAGQRDLSLTELFQAFPDRNFYAFEQSRATGLATLRRLPR